jgi:hypothetical protein
MQDGRVLVNLNNSTKLVALSPDERGSYINGTWAAAGNLMVKRMHSPQQFYPMGGWSHAEAKTLDQIL